MSVRQVLLGESCQTCQRCSPGDSAWVEGALVPLSGRMPGWASSLTLHLPHWGLGARHLILQH